MLISHSIVSSCVSEIHIFSLITSQTDNTFSIWLKLSIHVFVSYDQRLTRCILCICEIQDVSHVKVYRDISSLTYLAVTWPLPCQGLGATFIKGRFVRDIPLLNLATSSLWRRPSHRSRYDCLCSANRDDSNRGLHCDHMRWTLKTGANIDFIEPLEQREKPVVRHWYKPPDINLSIIIQYS